IAFLTQRHRLIAFEQRSHCLFADDFPIVAFNADVGLFGSFPWVQVLDDFGCRLLALEELLPENHEGDHASVLIEALTEVEMSRRFAAKDCLLRVHDGTDGILAYLAHDGRAIAGANSLHHSPGTGGGENDSRRVLAGVVAASGEKAPGQGG